MSEYQPDFHAENLTDLDEATDATKVVERLPHLGERFDHLVDLRASLDEFTWFGAEKVYGHGSADMKRVASIPHSVMNVMLAVDPTILLDRQRFYSWLSRHPEYRTTRKVPRC